ncbi:MAG: extracellular solute-binding protein [Acetatifactor sp.]|nr:extracellular solute-binding protein [Acetatifactor sp.]
MIAVLLILSGCQGRKVKEPVTITIWHVYGGQTDSPLNTLIEEFNESVGKEEGIRIQVSGVSNTNNIHDAVLRAANKEPGASELPDLFIAYPKTVLAMPDTSILVDYNDYFSPDELRGYVREFLKEGEIEERLLVFPVAKSTEIMFVNKTLFDRFSKETGAKLEDLSTWQGLFQLAERYFEWSGGKTFFVHDYWFNYFQVGVTSLGQNFFEGDRLNYGEAFQTAFDTLAEAAVNGAVWMQEGYATEPLRTGDAVVSVASSASVLYYEDQITYADNHSEPIELIAMPVPNFENGQKLVMQRGAGFCILKSTPERETAAVTFLKWLTKPENNLRFVTATGYMPVTYEAFELLPASIEKLEDSKYQSLYNAFRETQEQYHFYTAPQADWYLKKETSFETNVRLIFREAAGKYKEGMDPDRLKEDALKNLMDVMAK